MSFIIETERLRLREYAITDADFVLELFNSPKWKQFIGDRGLNTLEEAESYINERYLPAYSDIGYGAYVCMNEDDKRIGSCGLYKRPNLEHPDIGFALLPQYEGQGYAFEAASAVMQYASTTLNIDTIYGITLPVNLSSKNLLKKIGLHEVGPFQMEGDEEELLLFST